MRKSLLAVATLAASAIGAATLSVMPAHAVAGPALRVMPIGDSITWGVGTSSTNSYRADLWNTLTGAGRSLDFVGSQRSGNFADPDNEGHSGWYISDIAGIVGNVVPQYKPNVITLHIGTNDMNGNRDVATAPARLGSLIDQLTSLEPDATVVVAQIITASNSGTASRVKDFNAAIPALVQQRANAGKHVRVVSMSAVTTADLSDGLHPNESGFRKMAAAFDKGIEDSISAGWIKDPVGTPAGSSLRGQQSGRCADVHGASQASGTAVALWDCNGGANQKWVSTGSKQLQVYGNKCLDAVGASTANGTLVQIWDCNGQTNQQWNLNADGTVTGVASGKCLDAKANGTANNTVLQLWPCNGGANQKWSRS